MKVENLRIPELKIPAEKPVVSHSTGNTVQNLKEMVLFVAENYERISESEINACREKYKKNPNFVEIFDILINEYSQRIKTKEEIIKYTMRKCFKYVSEKILKISSSNNKASLTALCKRYFKNSKSDPDMLLPFREKSKNKTMNSYFLEELFSSEEFVADFVDFQNHIEEILVQDNDKRIDNYVKYLAKFVKKDKVDGAEKFKRIPWPRIWLEKTKTIANELISRKANNTESGNKKVKPNSVSPAQVEQNNENTYDTSSTISKIEEN